MKRIASAIALCLLIVSCTPEGDTYTLEILPVAKVEMETAFAKDSVTEISVKYLRPSNCHFYEDFYYERIDFTRVVAIYNAKLNKDNCQSVANDTVTVPLKFKPTQLGTYTFKFWKGTNNAGEDEYFEYDAVVNH
ncbi:MAG: hypothetical protein J0L86_04265 [Flavobacteriales bacterium]|nr:hypothetical protein [Flavobacteriales bacterium]